MSSDQDSSWICSHLNTFCFASAKRGAAISFKRGKYLLKYAKDDNLEFSDPREVGTCHVLNTDNLFSGIECTLAFVLM